MYLEYLKWYLQIWNVLLFDTSISICTGPQMAADLLDMVDLA